jgi:hypothetical protein
MMLRISKKHDGDKLPLPINRRIKGYRDIVEQAQTVTEQEEGGVL